MDNYKIPTVYIVSSGRSGTTLLASILNTSKQIYFPYESDFIARAYPFFAGKNSNIEEKNYKTIAKLFRKTARQQGWGMSEKYLIAQLKERTPKTLRQVYSVICEAFHRLEGTEKLLWGIKSPVLIANLERIWSICPEAKIIHIIRDGRDVFLSYKKIHEKAKVNKVKFGPKGVIANALFWIDGIRRIQSFKNSEKNKQIHELRYEDLLTNPEASLRNICAFLDLEFRHSMYTEFNSFEKNKKIAPEYMFNRIHTKVKSKIDSSNIGKHLASMSSIDKFIFELFAIPYLKKYDYQLLFSWLSAKILMPLRYVFFLAARVFNDWRYRRRDFYHYRQTLKAISEEALD